MNGKKRSVFSRWGRSKITPQQELEQEAADEAVLLDRDILERELRLIDDQHKRDSLEAQKRFITNWLSRTGSIIDYGASSATGAD